MFSSFLLFFSCSPPLVTRLVSFRTSFAVRAIEVLSLCCEKSYGKDRNKKMESRMGAHLKMSRVSDDCDEDDFVEEGVRA
jgi:hypothetical protein